MNAEKGYFFFFITKLARINNNHKSGISNHWSKDGDYLIKVLGQAGS